MHPKNQQLIILPKDLNFNGRTVAAADTVSTVFGTNGYTQLSLDLFVTRVAATVWTVFFERSPNYHLRGSASASWSRCQAESVGAIAAGACTITLGDATYSFTTAVTDTISIELPINAYNMRFTVSNTAGTTDTATAYITLGSN